MTKMESLFTQLATLPEEEDFTKARAVIEKFLDALERGELRAAHRIDNRWCVDERVKKGILMAFKLGRNEAIEHGPFCYFDKDNLKPRRFNIEDGVRLVPGAATVRRGAFLGKNVIAMSPSYVNVGAFVDEGTMIDSNALVGSCAQIGKRVHISAGAQIGGVLEPIQASPVIVEDDVFIGGNCGVFEGIEIGSRAVLAASVNLTNSTKIYDLLHEREIARDDRGVVRIPEGAVVVAGSRAASTDFARTLSLSINCALIVKYRDQKSDAKLELSDFLRG